MLVVPESKDCFETIAILNYNKFSYKVEEDYRNVMRRHLGYSKNDEYPLMIIDSNLEELPTSDLMGKEEIFSSLYNLKLIGPYKSYSAYENIGLTFVEETFEPALDDFFRSFLPLVQYYMQPRQFMQTRFNYEKPRTMMFNYLWKMRMPIKIWLREYKNHVN